jgi:DNA polymerase-3 subunit delta'
MLSKKCDRAETFAGLIGQQQAIALLLSAIERDRIAPAYLFAGAAGVGKKIAAQCFCRILLRDTSQTSLENHPDFLWIEATYQEKGKLLTKSEAAAAGELRKVRFSIRIEQIRELIDRLSRPPLKAPRSLVVIEDAETMTEAAANALLKTLEEPGKATIILIASSSDLLLPTLVSRCQRIPFHPLSQENLKQVLQQIGCQEILNYPEIVAIAQGSAGRAIESFAQLQNFPTDLLKKLTQPMNSPLQAMTLAKEIDRELDVQTQLWLVDYLQYFYWHNSRQQTLIKNLENTRQYLLGYVQSRLVWETTLLSLIRDYCLLRDYA